MSKNETIEPKRLKGFRDYQPASALLRQKIIDTVRETALASGFLPIDTPAIEYAEVLLGTGGEETDKEVYRFQDHGGRSIALRYDLTVPFARFVAEHYGELVFPFKKLQIGEVWRGEKPQKGRFRQFCQADLDIIGVDSMNADIEALVCIQLTLQKLIPGSFTLFLGNRLLLSAIIRSAFGEISSLEETRTLIALDKVAKIGIENVKKLFLDVVGNQEKVNELLNIVSAKDSNGNSDFRKIRDYLQNDLEAGKELDRFEGTVKILRELLGSGSARVTADLSIARGLGYYTGIVFETTIDALPGFGSVSSGGRYNKLVSRFGRDELPGVGGSIGVDRLLSALEELQVTHKEQSVSVFLAIATEDARGYGFSILKSLRESGIRADIGLKEKLSAQFKYANKLNIPFVITVGSEEAEKNQFNLKNMNTGEEEKGLPLEQLCPKVKACLSGTGM